MMCFGSLCWLKYYNLQSILWFSKVVFYPSCHSISHTHTYTRHTHTHSIYICLIMEKNQNSYFPYQNCNWWKRRTFLPFHVVFLTAIGAQIATQFSNFETKECQNFHEFFLTLSLSLERSYLPHILHILITHTYNLKQKLVAN